MVNGSTEVTRGERVIDGRHKVTVIDTPGIDFKSGCEESFARQFKDICVKINCGINAFVFVLPYGKRLTENELFVLEMFREMFGAEYFYKYGLPVFTRGDDFETDPETEGKTWQEWLASLPDDSMEKKIMGYFENEPMLINNRKRDDNYKREKSRSLINLAEHVSREGTYGFPQFEEANMFFEIWKDFADFLKKLWRRFLALFSRSTLKTSNNSLYTQNKRIVMTFSINSPT